MSKQNEHVNAAPPQEDGARFPRSSLLLFFVPLFVLGAVLGYRVAGLAGQRVYKGVSVAGRPVGGLTAEEVRSKLAQWYGPLRFDRVTLVFADNAWHVTPASLGMTVDYAGIAERAIEVGRSGDLFSRLRERKAVGRQGRDLPLTFRIDKHRWEEFCRETAGAVEREPVRARLFVNRTGRLRVEPSRDGLALDRAGLAEIFKQSFLHPEQRRYEIPTVKIRPELSSEDIAEWPLDQVLGIYTTKFTAEDIQRTNNLAMAAAAIDGVILGPGEEFSFNRFVGPRVPEKGYLEAGVVSRNRVVLGMGGGVCQVSGTLFNAALLAGLPVPQRVTHSLPSTYVPLGRDATVVYDAVDLVFVNDTGRPLVVTSAMEGSYLTVALVGHRDSAPRVELEVEIRERIPFETVTENDPGLATGTEAVVHEGREGYRVQLWRTMTWPGKPAVREPIGKVAYYPPVKRVIKRGIGSPRYGARLMPLPPAPDVPPDGSQPAAEGEQAPLESGQYSAGQAPSQPDQPADGSNP